MIPNLSNNIKKQHTPMLSRIHCNSKRYFPQFHSHISNQRFAYANTLSSRYLSTKENQQQELFAIANALKQFHDKNKHFIIPREFVTETYENGCSIATNTLPLGRIVIAIRRAVSNRHNNSKYLKPFFVEQLDRIGFPLFNWTQYEFKQITLPGLKTFQALHGHLMVPQRFVVPLNDHKWPQQLWIFRLGQLVNRVRKGLIPLTPEQVDHLNAIGFIWKVADARWEREIFPALEIYKKLTGHLMVPSDFCVPSDSPNWPKHLWGFALGRTVQTLRRGCFRENFEQNREKLTEMGFMFEVNKMQWETKILPSLRVFVKVYDHADVPQKFVVPSQSPWPEDAWGMNLGTIVSQIRKKTQYRKGTLLHAKNLAECNFIWNRKERLEYNVHKIIVPCLQTFWKRFPEKVSITITFRVPAKNEADHAEWPEAAWGFRLGQWISRCRSGKISVPFDLVQVLENAGFTWQYTEARWKRYILPALEAYAAVHGGSCRDMGTRFSVPRSEPYPRQTWGFNLGGAVWHIRNGDTYADPDKVAHLKRLGVVS